MAEPTHIYLSGVLYDLDVRNGLNACDGFYTPYDICIDINAGEDKFFYFVCSTEDVSCNGFDVLKSMDARKKNYMTWFLKRWSFKASDIQCR